MTPLHYDDGREIRDQIIDFDTLQEARPLGLVFTKPGRDEAVEARFYSIKSFPEQLCAVADERPHRRSDAAGAAVFLPLPDHHGRADS